AAVVTARWRAGDRDQLARRLIPWVLAAGRRAARRRDAPELARLDGLVSRLALGMTAGEEELPEELLGRRAALALGDVLALHAPRAMVVAVARVGERLRMHPLRRRELLKPREGGLRGTEPGRDLLAPFLYARLSHVQPPQQRREREPLAQQGHEDHCERDGD